MPSQHSILLGLCGACTALWLSACGVGMPGATPSASPTLAGSLSGTALGSSTYSAAGTSTDPSSGAMDPTPSPGPAMVRPTPPATGSVLISSLGAGQLVSPQGIAFAGGSLFVADRDHRGLLGNYGAVLRLDPAAGQRQGVYFLRSASESVPVDITGVGVATVSVGSQEAASLVYPVSPWAVFGFGAPTEFPLNFGRPFVPGGQAIAISGNDAWVAEDQQVRAFHLPDWLPEIALPVNQIFVSGARGLGVDNQGTPWIVANGRIYDGTVPFAETQVVPRDPRSVAYDSTTGTILVLDSDRVLRYNLDGTYVGAFGQGELHDPVGLAVGDDGCVYVSDTAERVVFRFAPP
ncbi:MAG: hypothetical protein KGR26_07095 [Cyanobacteria bacterium REEB65]|nr:hypothetical protein [Cyanobacteria bacterium REEB65]